MFKFFYLLALVSSADLAATMVQNIPRIQVNASIHPKLVLATSTGKPKVNKIRYQKYGAKVLTGDVNMVYIYIGTWTPTQKAILEDFGNNISNSDWYKTTKLYYYQERKGAKKIMVNGNVKVIKSIVAPPLNSTAIPDSYFKSTLQNLIDTKQLTEDPNAVYMFFTDPDISFPDFCRTRCGYHSFFKMKSGNPAYYGVMGNGAKKCLLDCAEQSTSPNGDAGLDGVINFLAHELTEIVTDPEINAWYDSPDPNTNLSLENADKCLWEFGTTIALNGFKYNENVGTKKYLIQQNWNPKKQRCE